MLITKIILDHYKPLLHNGITHIEVADIPQITILSGENGSGKSSMLREITPYPATRTDYEKNGYKIIEILHNNIHYKLTSDFSKNPAHSFLKGGIELNTSGTTEVQCDLVDAHFGYSSLLDKLISGQCKICQMGKPERKSLIMSTYPSDLTFVLDYHKQLCSRIRACANNLKLMNERKLKLMDSLLSDDLHQRNKQYKEDLVNLLNHIDRDLYILRKDIEDRQSSLPKDMNDIIGIEAGQKQLKELFDKHAKLVKTYKSDIVPDSLLDKELGKVEAEFRHIKKYIKELQDKACDLRDEIEKLNQCLQTNTEENIKHYQELLAYHKDIVNQYHPNSKIHPLSKEELDMLVEIAPAIKEDLYTLSSNKQWHWSSVVYQNAEYRLKQWKDTLNNYKREYYQLTQNIQHISEQLSNTLSGKSYPKDCSRVCDLRMSLEKVTHQLESTKTNYIHQQEQILSEINLLTNKINLLEEALSTRYTERGIIHKLERLETNKHWANFITFGLPIILAINSNSSKIVSNIDLLIYESEQALKVKNSLENIKTIELNLKSLTESNLPTKQFINESILAKQTTLRLTEETIIKNNVVAQKLDQKLLALSLEQEVNYQITENVIPRMRAGMRAEITLSIIELLKDKIQYLESVKNQINEQLRKLENTIREQESYLTRLNDEVQPTIDTLTEKMKMYQAVEKEISPICGIPHFHIIRYLNTLFEKANRFIRKVWNYDMELAYFKEDEPFDYTFKVLLNQNSEVKDVNICSEGQKAIINLAVTLAICSYRQFSKQYPLKLDEFTNGLSVDHVNRLMLTLSDALKTDDSFFRLAGMQLFMVSHDLVVVDALPDAACVALSETELSLTAKTNIGNIERK